MHFGISVYDVGPRELVDIAVAAEDAGFDSLWLGEHLFLPCGYETVHPTQSGTEKPERSHFPRIVEPDTQLTDPWVGLAAVAATTRTIRLATGIYVLPLRHPLLTARSAATMGELSGGRFMLGVGSGWLREEFDAFGVPFETRGARQEEALSVLRQAFAGGPFVHRGEHFSFDAVQVSPRRVDVPLILGGNSQPALRRAARFADGWFASGNPAFEDAVALKRRLEELRSGPMPCYVRAGAFDPDVVVAYAAAGFDSLIFWAQDVMPLHPGDRRRAFELAAEQLRSALASGCELGDERCERGLLP